MEGVVFHFFPYNVGNASSLPFRLQCNVPLWVACQLLHVIKSNIKHTEILLLQSVPCGPGPALSSGASECSASKRGKGGLRPTHLASMPLVCSHLCRCVWKRVCGRKLALTQGKQRLSCGSDVSTLEGRTMYFIVQWSAWNLLERARSPSGS